MIVVKTKTRGKPRGRKRPEIRKEHRTARWPGIDTRVSTILATSSWSAMVGLPATRTEVRSRETMLAQSRARLAIATRAQTPQGCATQPVCLRPPASKWQDWSALSTLDAVRLIETTDPLLALTDAAARKQ